MQLSHNPYLPTYGPFSQAHTHFMIFFHIISKSQSIVFTTAKNVADPPQQAPQMSAARTMEFLNTIIDNKYSN